MFFSIPDTKKNETARKKTLFLSATFCFQLLISRCYGFFHAAQPWKKFCGLDTAAGVLVVGVKGGAGSRDLPKVVPVEIFARVKLQGLPAGVAFREVAFLQNPHGFGRSGGMFPAIIPKPEAEHPV